MGKGFEFLDQELLTIIRGTKNGRILVDRLIRVYLREGSEVWVLIHIEVHGRVNPQFPERMYVYSYRIYDKYSVKVASFAILTDSNPIWKPTDFSYKLFGCEVMLKFPIVKILDY